MGATLSQGLEWILKGNSKGLTTEIDKGKKAVKDLGKETEKTSDGMAKGFLKTKESISKARGALLFYGAAIAALVTPALQAMDAQKKFAVAATLVGEKIGKGLAANVKTAADAMGTTFTAAATKAASVMTRFGTDSTNALATVVQSWKTAKLGIATEAESIEAIAQVAKASHTSLGKVATELAPAMNAAATLTGNSLGTIASALSTIATPAALANVSLKDVNTALVAMDAMGIPIQQSQGMIATALTAAIQPSKDQQAALDQLGLNGYNALASIGNQNFLPFMGHALASITTQRDSVGTLLGNISGVNAQYASTAPEQFAKAASNITAEVEKQNKALDIQPSAIERISAAWTRVQEILAVGIAPLMEGLASKIESMVSWASELGTQFGQWWYNGGKQEMLGGAQIPGFATGGWVPGQGSGDRVPALLEPGEFVVNKKAAQAKKGWLQALNDGGVQHFDSGGSVDWKALAIAYYAKKAAAAAGMPIAPPLAPRQPSAWETFGGSLASMARTPLSSMSGMGRISVAAMRFPWLFGGMGQAFAGAGGFGGYLSAYKGFGYKDGGEVRGFAGVKRMAAGGTVTKMATSAIPQGKPIGNSPSLHVDTLNVNLKGATFTPTFVRDYVVPPLMREMESGRNRRARTGR